MFFELPADFPERKVRKGNLLWKYIMETYYVPTVETVGYILKSGVQKYLFLQVWRF